MSNEFPIQQRNCKEFLRHKQTMCSPKVLEKHKIPFYRGYQTPGCFIITMPGSYHSGFNSGKFYRQIIQKEMNHIAPIIGFPIG